MFITSMVRHFEEIRSPCAYPDYHPHGLACSINRDGIETPGAVRLRNGWMIVLFAAVAFSMVTIVFLLIEYNKTETSESNARLVWHDLGSTSTTSKLLNNSTASLPSTPNPFVWHR